MSQAVTEIIQEARARVADERAPHLVIKHMRFIVRYQLDDGSQYFLNPEEGTGKHIRVYEYHYSVFARLGRRFSYSRQNALAFYTENQTALDVVNAPASVERAAINEFFDSYEARLKPHKFMLSIERFGAGVIISSVKIGKSDCFEKERSLYQLRTQLVKQEIMKWQRSQQLAS